MPDSTCLFGSEPNLTIQLAFQVPFTSVPLAVPVNVTGQLGVDTMPVVTVVVPVTAQPVWVNATGFMKLSPALLSAHWVWPLTGGLNFPRMSSHLLIFTRVFQLPSHRPLPVLWVGQVAAVVAAAVGADDAGVEDVGEADPVPIVFEAVQPASATAVTTNRIAIMPYDEIFTILLSTPEKFPAGDLQSRH